MTTMELIEKHGIGYNCLSDAYDLGVKHGKAEANARIEPLIREIHDKVAETEYEKGKADTIEKVIKVVRNHHPDIIKLIEQIGAKNE